MKRTLAAAGLSTALVLTGCGVSSEDRPRSVEVEDCDAGDMLERDEDCGFTKKKSSTTKKSGSTGTKTKSRSSTTRRK